MMKWLMVVCLLSVTGCVTSVTTEAYRYSEETGRMIAKARTSIFTLSDKRNESAGEGIFADAAKDAEGSGIRSVAARAEGSGFAETFKGVGDMLKEAAKFVESIKGFSVSGALGTAGDVIGAVNGGE